MAFFAAKENKINNVCNVQKPEMTIFLSPVCTSNYDLQGKDGMTHQCAVNVV